MEDQKNIQIDSIKGILDKLNTAQATHLAQDWLVDFKEKKSFHLFNLMLSIWFITEEYKLQLTVTLNSKHEQQAIVHMVVNY